MHEPGISSRLDRKFDKIFQKYCENCYDDHSKTYDIICDAMKKMTDIHGVSPRGTKWVIVDKDKVLITLMYMESI